MKRDSVRTKNVTSCRYNLKIHFPGRRYELSSLIGRLTRDLVKVRKGLVNLYEAAAYPR
jgi:hypothetical protein